MFSGAPASLAYAVVLADGTVEDVDLGDHLVNPRRDLAGDRVLPERVCRATPGSRAVVISRLFGEEEIPCR